MFAYTLQYKITEAARQRDAAALTALLHDASLVAKVYPITASLAHLRIAKTLLAELQDEQSVVARMQDVLTRDVVTHEQAYRDVLAEADAKELGRKTVMRYSKWVVISVNPESVSKKETAKVVERVREVLDSLRQRAEAISVLKEGTAAFNKSRIELGLQVRCE